MNKTQKAGFIISASVFIVIGIIFLIAGFAAKNSFLKIAGIVWVPTGTINLLLILRTIKKEK